MSILKFIKAHGRIASLIVVVLIGAMIAAVMVHIDADGKTYTVRQACDVLPESVAKQIGGKNLQKIAKSQTESDDSVTSYCVFRNADGSSVSVIVRSPKNEAGAQQNQQVFDSPPVANEVVRGYGDRAYWAQSLGQLSVLAHDNWYLLGSGSKQPAERTLEQAQVLARAIQDRL